MRLVDREKAMNTPRPVRENATDAELHPGSEVTRCPCEGYLA